MDLANGPPFVNACWKLDQSGKAAVPVTARRLECAKARLMQTGLIGGRRLGSQKRHPWWIVVEGTLALEENSMLFGGSLGATGDVSEQVISTHAKT